MTAPDTRPETRAEPVAWMVRDFWNGEPGPWYVQLEEPMTKKGLYRLGKPFHKEGYPLYAQPTQHDAMEALREAALEHFGHFIQDVEVDVVYHLTTVVAPNASRTTVYDLEAEFMPDRPIEFHVRALTTDEPTGGEDG